MIDTLLNCDCMEFMKTMADKSVDMTLTDIPYNELNKIPSAGLREFNKGDADNMTFNLSNFLNEVDRITNGTIAIFCGIEQMSSIFKFFKDKGYPTRQLIWEKVNPMPINGRVMYLSALENAIWAKKRGGYLMAFAKVMFFTLLLVVGTSTLQRKITTFFANLLSRILIATNLFLTLVLEVALLF